MKRFLLFLFSLVMLLPLFSQPIYASEYFSREYGVVYNVNENGKTNVSVTVTLKNKTSDYYASSDTITVGFPEITNVTARDPDGAITPQVKKTDAGNSIEIPFNKKVVGKDNSLVFTITFDTPDVARHSGKIWEINIPGIANPDEFENFNVEVKVPPSFGEPSYIKPTQPDKKLLFTKDQLGKSGISIAYGREQIYTFNLMYHLKNNNVFPITTELALPPTTNYQEIVIDSMSPKPKNVKLDKDGNWLAEYALVPSQKIDVQVIGRAKVVNTPQKQAISREERVEYTKERSHWQTTNAEIKRLARELKTPQAIYEYVVENLHYDFNRVTTDKPRLGAVEALKNPNSAVCLEFTDLFIAIARAAGIPAREVNGYAHTENSKQRPLSLVQDILHSWPEYYDDVKGTWVMVDPTWGNTTGGTDYFNVFDVDHLVFIRKGVNSQYPIPAGGYKVAGDEQKKDISVQFTSSFPTTIPQIEMLPLFPEKTLAGFPIVGTVTVTNTTGVLFPEKTAVTMSNDLRPRRQEIYIAPIPPFGSVEVEVPFNKTPFFANRSYDFTFSLQDTIIQKRVHVTPFAFSRNQIIGGIIGVIFTIIILIIASKTWRIFIFKRRR